MSKSVEEILRTKFRKIKKTRGSRGLELRINCPFCGGDKGFHMYVNPQREVYNCFKCGAGGSLQKLLGELYSPQFRVRNVVPAEREEPLPENVRPPGLTVPVNALEPEHPALEYITRTRKRPFSPDELAQYYGVRYCVQGEKFRAGDAVFDTTNTLIFPVWMFEKVVGWQSRLLFDPDKLTSEECEALGFSRDEDGDWNRPPKYLTSPGFKKGRVLYNFDLARKFPYVVVTEGVFDAMSAGLPAVATFGTGISEQQCRLLKTYWSHVIIMLDPDGTDKATEELYSELHRAVGVTHVKLHGYKDPGDAPREEIWRQVSASMEHGRKLEKAITMDGFRYREQGSDPEKIRKLWKTI